MLKVAGSPIYDKIHPPIPNFYLHLLTKFISHAWDLIINDRLTYDPKSYSPGDFDKEKRITASLKYALKTKTEIASYVDVCEDHVYSCDGIEKEPDLTFIPHQTSYRGTLLNALFVECKLLQCNDNLSKYVSEGILRFVEGEYAWRMPHGMMIAYVHEERSCKDSLVEYFKNATGEKAKICLPLNGVSDCRFAKCITHDIFLTKHKRYCPNGGTLPKIEINHFWLSVPRK